MTWRRGCTLAALASLQFGCTTKWSVIAPAIPQTFPAKQKVQVWTGIASTELRSVVVGADSITGIAGQGRTDCLICRIGLPRAAVDSMRVGGIGVSPPRALGITAAALLIATVFVCSRGGCTAD